MGGGVRQPDGGGWVDLRCRLLHPPSRLQFDAAPAARIPDGNLLRILYLAIREGLRVAILKRRVAAYRDAGLIAEDAKVHLLPRRPTMRTLLAACKALAKHSDEAEKIILYPDPVLGSGDYEAAQALMAAQLENARIATPKELITSETTGS